MDGGPAKGPRAAVWNFIFLDTVNRWDIAGEMKWPFKNVYVCMLLNTT